jgi:hypothetical protein
MRFDLGIGLQQLDELAFGRRHGASGRGSLARCQRHSAIAVDRCCAEAAADDDTTACIECRRSDVDP